MKRKFVVYALIFLGGILFNEFGFMLFKLVRKYEIVRREQPTQQEVPAPTPTPEEKSSSSWFVPQRNRDKMVI